MTTYALRLVRVLRELKDMRTALFPSPTSDLFSALVRAELEVKRALYCTPEYQAEVGEYRYTLAPVPPGEQEESDTPCLKRNHGYPDASAADRASPQKP